MEEYNLFDEIEKSNSIRQMGGDILYKFGDKSSIEIDDGKPDPKYDSVTDAITGIGSTIAGMASGAVSATAGLPTDIGAFFVGIKDAVSAEDGERIDQFTKSFTEFSKQNYGSEFFKEKFDSFVDSLNISDQYKEDAKSGYSAGEFGGVGGTVTAGGKATIKGGKKVLETLGEKAQRDLDLDTGGATLSMNAVGEADKLLKQGLAKFAPSNVLEDTKLVLNKRAEEMKLPTNKRTMPSGQNPLFNTSDEAYQKVEVDQKETPVPRKTDQQVYPLNNRSQAIVDKMDAIADVLAKKIIPFKGRNIQYFYNTSPIIQKAVELGIPKETAITQLIKFSKNYASTSPRTMTDQNLRNASLVATKENIGVDLEKILGPGGDGMNEKGYPMMIGPTGIHKKLIDASKAEGISFDTNPKPATFAENVAGNLEGVTVDTHAIRAVIDAINELEPGSVPIEWIGGKTAQKTKEYQEMYKNDPSSLDVSTMVRDTLETQAINKISKQTEYAVFSDLYKKVAEKAGVRPAEAQSLSWFANGDKTGLASEPKTIVELIDDRIDVTSQLTGFSKEEVFKKFMEGSIPLASVGGLTLLDTGAMIDEGNDDELS
jgi:ubiquitin